MTQEKKTGNLNEPCALVPFYCRDCHKHQMHKEQKGSSRSEAYNMLNDPLKNLTAYKHKGPIPLRIARQYEKGCRKYHTKYGEK